MNTFFGTNAVATVNVGPVASSASNIRDGTNPAYDTSDFYTMYPAFGPDKDNNQLVPDTVVALYLNLAHASIKEARWHDAWKIGIGLFVAHFVTLYLQSVSAAGSPAAMVIADAQAKGLVTSNSVGDISESIDYNAIANDLEGWAQWKLTQFGIQFASMAELIGKGGMLVL